MSSPRGPGETIPLIGFGGNHYAARETDIALAGRAAWGHIAHTREVAGMDAAMIRQMAALSSAEVAYIDRKAFQGGMLSKKYPFFSMILVFPGFRRANCG
ncbi:D-aminoacyl-tRNA deacylase [Methanogenium cariaci]|uniref:D-aminoacyl-tRNA deacylase n=1 Tax=Methanogenium cariaci TaxID=2197 RepID=UPI000785DA21|nr:D-aminoacyl-tRNA deacylase [Methanogenium cariaci]